MGLKRKRQSHFDPAFFSVEPSLKLNVESPEHVYRYELAAFVIHTYTLHPCVYSHNVACQVFLSI